ncbi:hypothetical protein F1559_000810 [Cyanidiococcus yangmingshanensis]|uniref:C2 domain-containing protein n=1 Tax=Cyanidiococcus yangmingshanensis TaxID=2690220 RepID=A0A7J7IEA5_9RHOD|nr:hypothetical protein F1559_000810 [Cyanidiococcus yangmingshanensis]
MFISNPVVLHGSMLASFSLRSATVEVPHWPLTRSAEESTPNVAQYHATTRLIPVSNHDVPAPEARHAHAPIYAGMPTWILPRECEANTCQANRYLLVSLLSVHHLGLHEFGLDPSAESLTLRLYLNIRDGTYRSAPFRVSNGTVYSADRNTVIDTILMRLPSSLDNLTSLHIILESADGGKFFASANISPEEWAEKQLLTGGLQQYGLESLENAMRTRNAKRKRGKPAEHTKPTPTPFDAERDHKLVDLATVRRRLHEHWHHDIRGSALALWAALVNYLVETAPEFALRFGMEETEFPPSLLTPWLLRFFRLVHHRGLVAALEHYERASHSEHHGEHALRHGSASHEHHKITPQHIHEELEKHLRSCTIFSETLLRHGLTRHRRHGIHLFSKTQRHQSAGSKPTLASRTRSESTPKAMLRMWFSRHKQNTKAAPQQTPSTARVSSLSTDPAPETETRASMNNDSSKERQPEVSGKERQPSQGLARKSLSAETTVAELAAVAAERTSSAFLKSNWIPTLRRRGRMRTRRHEAEDRLSLLFHESKRYQDPVPVGKLALDLRLLEADPGMTAEDASTSASPLRVERVQDVQQFRAEHHKFLRDRFQPRMDVIVRLHVFNARGLRAPSGDPNIYLKIELNRGEQTQSTKRSPVRHSLHPDLFQSFEFTGVRLPGSSLVIRVKHFSGPEFEVPNAAVLLPRYENWTFGPFVHQAISKDLRIDLVRTRVGHGVLLGETEIDLDQRWYSENDSFSRLEPPIETRRLFVPNRVIHRGEITLRLELLSAAEAATRPFRRLEPPAPRQYELRLVIWRVMGCKKEGTEKPNQKLASDDAYGSADADSGNLAPQANSGSSLNASADATVPLQDLEVHAQLGNDISSEMRTSVVHNCDDGSANFNYRLIWRPLHWPNPDLVPRLRLHVWDVRKPSGFPLIGQLVPSEPELLATVTLDLSSIFEEARHSHERIHRPRQWILMHRVGTACATTVPRIAVSLDLLSKEQAMQHPEGSQIGQSGLPEPLQPVPFSAFAPQRYVRYRIARLWQDGFWYAVQVALLIPGGIALLKTLASIPLLLYLFGAVTGTLLVLRMRRIERELEFV